MLVANRFKKILFVTALLMLAVFFVTNDTEAAGLTVGNNAQLLNMPHENLFYGVTDVNNATGSFLLFEKGYGNPVFKIDYNGNITTNGSLLGSNSYWNLNGSNLFASSTTWNVGIGTTTTGAYKLNVVGNTNIVGALTATSFSGTYSGTIGAPNVSSGAFGSNTGGGNYSFPGTLTSTDDLTVNGGDISLNNNNGGINYNDASAYWLKTTTNWGLYWDTATNQIKFNGGGTNRSFIDLDDGAAYFNGSVGIGITAPTQKLDVNGNILGSNIYAPGFENFRQIGSLTNKVIGTDVTQIAQSPIPGFLWHDILAFSKIGTPVFETSVDGTNWVGGSLDKRLFSQVENQSITVLNAATQEAVRWTWSSGIAWSSAEWMILAYSYSSTGVNATISIDSSVDGVTWTNRHLSTFTGNAAPYWLHVSSFAGDTRLRLTITSNAATGSLNLSSIRLLTSRWGDQGLGSELSYPYTWDGDQNISFPGNLTVDTNSLFVSGVNNNVGIGTTNPGAYKLYVNGDTNINGVITATTFSGAMTGTLSSANVSAGAFGSNTGGGNYSFPGTVGIGITAPGSKVHIGLANSDSTTAPTTITRANEYLHLGKQEYNANSYRLIGFGYTQGATIHSPAYIGYQETNTGGETLGDLIFGTRSVTSDTQPTERMRIAASGNVGIGTTNPTAKLQVIGSGSASSMLNNLAFFGSPASTVAGELYGIFIDKSGYGGLMMGINKNTVTGNVPADSLFLSSWGSNQPISFGRGGDNNLPSTVDLFISSVGNVGIGTTNPGSNKLQVNGIIYANNSANAILVSGAASSRAIYSDNSNFYTPSSHNGSSWLRNSSNLWTFQGGTAGDDWTQVAQLYLNPVGTAGADDKLIELGQRQSNSTAGDYKGLRVVHYTGSAIADGYFQAGNAYFSGNVGIGTSTPTTAKLVIAPSGSYSIDALGGRIGNITSSLDTDAASVAYVKAVLAGTSTIPTVGYWTANGTNISNANSGNVGIGTTAPGAALEISNATVQSLRDGYSDLRLEYNGGESAGDSGAQLTFAQKYFGADPGIIRVGAVRGLKTQGAGSFGGGLQLLYQPAGDVDMVPGITLTQNGYVGINTTNPGAYTLNVNGNTNITGTLTATSFSGPLSGTISSANVSAGAFASNTGGGDFSFPSNLTTTGYINSVAGYRFNGAAASGSYLRGNGTNFVSNTIQAADVPTLNQNTTGYAGLLNYEDNRTISPSELTANRMRFGFTAYDNNNTSPWADFLHFRSYQDSSGGNDNLLVLNRNGLGMRLYQQTYGTTTAYSMFKDIVLADNSPTVNYVPKYSSNSDNVSVANSQIYDNGTLVGIGTTTGAFKLNVNGNTNVNGVLTATTFSGAMSGTLSAANVSSGAFASNTGGGNFSFPGNVGVGTNAPVNKFEVADSNATTFEAGGFYNTYAYGDANKAESRINIGKIEGVNRQPMGAIGAFPLSNADSSNGILSFYTRQTQIMNERMRITTTGNVGIGTTNPNKQLHVTDDIWTDTSFQVLDRNSDFWLIQAGSGATEYQYGVRFQGAADKLDLANSYGDVNLIAGTAGTLNSSYLTVKSGGNVGIGTSTPLTKLHVVGGTTIEGNLVMTGSANVSGINKITVNTVDPLYSILGTNYSSFAPSVVGGVKEEVTGKININTKVGNEYQAVINFDKQAEGSDLWVWHKVIDFNKNNVEAVITPYGSFANTYYYINNNTLVFRSDRPVEIAYRLLAKRFDWKEWPTRATDQTEKAGLIIK